MKADYLIKPKVQARSRGHRPGASIAAHISALLVLSVTFGAVLSVGCGKPGLQTAKVHGVVTLDGKPYSQGGSVLFRPESKGKMGSSPIESDGTYRLTTYSSGDGAVIGKHKVTVMPLPPEITGEDSAPVKGSGNPFASRFLDPSQSGLECDVIAGQSNEFNIDLKSK